MAVMTVPYDSLKDPGLTLQMPNAPLFFGTAPRATIGIQGYYSIFKAFAASGGLPGGPRTVSGQVKDPDGVNIAGYTVRMYDRANGQFIAETTSGVGGVFTFDNMDSRLVDVYAIDNVGNVWKAPIVDRITPSL